MTPNEERDLDLREAEPPPPGVRAMSIVRWALVVLMAFVATGSLLSYFASRGPGADSAHATATYYCPMHPQIVQDHPGECPICSMTLVIRPASAAAKPAPSAVPGLAPIELPADRVQLIGVRTEKVQRQALAGEVRTVGVVAANERGLATLSPRFAGWIEELFVAETGQHVEKGQVLATIFSPEVLKAQQELLTALGWSSSPGPAPHREALDDLAADARRRLELLGISAPEIDAVIKRGQVQRAIAIRSPVSGDVISKTAVVGMNVAPGAPLFEIADLSTVWVIAEVYEADLQRVRVGQPARFLPSGTPGEGVRGKVKFVYPTVDTSSRTLRVRLEMPNHPGRAGGKNLVLRPGMYGSVTLELPATTGLLVPADALVDTGDLRYVFVAREGGRFEPRRVKVGARAGDRIELLEGVVEGETVVTTANFLIDSESRLRAAISGGR
jgi:Cu(I)/Ag(I) efflux system membrane fusion protein